MTPNAESLKKQTERAAKRAARAGRAVVREVKAHKPRISTGKTVTDPNKGALAPNAAPGMRAPRRRPAERPESPIQHAAREGVTAHDKVDGGLVARDDDVQRIAGAITSHRSALMDRLAK